MGSSPIRVANHASVAQSVEQGTENPRVGGSIPPGGTIFTKLHKMREWLSGRASPCQGERREFESRLPLQKHRLDGVFLLSEINEVKRMFSGKMKAITFSYDDGTIQDIRLTKLLSKYNLKATFNINSELFGAVGEFNKDGRRADVTRVKKEDVKHVYDGHEVAVHTLTHDNLTQIEDEKEILRQVEQDRINLSEIVGYDVVGMAYPCGGVNCNDYVANLIKEKTSIRYARALPLTESFDPYPDLYQYCGTLYHGDRENLFKMGEEFLKMKPETPKVFYIWGHSFEFDLDEGRWEWFEEFLKMIANKDDIFYGTNKEVLL